MKFCLTFHNDIFKRYPDFDEVIIKYFEKDLTIFDFVSKEDILNKRLILNIVDYKLNEEDFSDLAAILKKLQAINPKISILLSIKQYDFSQVLKENGIPFFFYKVAETWDELRSLTKEEISDVYIGSELGFRIAEVADFCHKLDIKVRVFANVAQTSAPLKNMTDISSFFIRPEDLAKYEEYVDTVEFFGPLDRQGVLLKIYKRGSWEGSLSDIIVGYKNKIANHTIAPQFGNIRLKCQKKCCQNKCNMCFKIEEIAEKVDNLGFRFKENKHNEKNER
jgi:hypothetical protein